MAAELFRFSRRDAVLVQLALLHGALLCGLCLVAPERPSFSVAASLVIAALVWWSSNTVSHIHLHNPLFSARGLNRAFSLYLSLVLGVPQTLWRDKHLWHHAGEPQGRKRRSLDGLGWLEVAGVMGVFVALYVQTPRFAVFTYAPGYLLGLLLCYVQGHYEHAGLPVARNPGLSYYGSFYNRLWFNDGYHAEHHRHPGEHWTRLPHRAAPAVAAEPVAISSFPPVLRFLEGSPWIATALTWLEHLALRPGVIQRFMLRTHRRALAALLSQLGTSPQRIAVVGGGLFPRTAILLGQLLPRCRLTVIDASATNLQRAREHLAQHASSILPRVSFEHARFETPEVRGFDLVIVPLAFVGDRERLYQTTRGARPAFFVHDWIWRRRGRAGVVISWWLGKRLNFIAPSTSLATTTAAE
jgi:hypothetical protein